MPSWPSTTTPQRQQEWTGRIVARILSRDMDKDYELSRKPVAGTRIEPSTLCEGTGPLSHNPQGPRANGKFLSKNENGIYNDKECSFIRLDVYLFSNKNSSQVPLCLVLTRQSDEDAMNCLNRLGLNIAKKLKLNSIHKSKDKKIKREAIPTQSQAFVHTEREYKPLEISGMQNQEFWGLSLTKPLTIEISINGTTIPCHVECNPPTITSVSTYEKFAQKIFPGIPLIIEVGTMFATKAVVDWYANGELISKDCRCYIPSKADTGKILSVMITPIRPDHTGQGYQEAYQFREKVESEIPENGCLAVRPSWQLPRSREPGSDLRILSFNVLADQNAYSGPDRHPFFPWVSADVLDRSRRMPLVLHEILSYHADIICLQEVDQLVFETLLRPTMEYYNYQGFYSIKQTEGNREGGAMFWSLDRFQKATESEMKTFQLGELIGQYTEPLHGGDSQWNECAKVVQELLLKRPDLKDIITNKLGHVLQIAHLRDKNGNQLIASNTHLFYHQMGCHIRTLQLFAIAHQLTIEQGIDPQNNIKPFIFCGDLNTSSKNCVNLLLKKKISKNFRDYRECLNTFDWEREEATLDLKFDDDFPEIRLPDTFPDIISGYPETPDFTHYIIGFQATLDHILMTSQTRSAEFQPLRQAAIPSEEEVTRKYPAMPSPCFPSDHMSIVADVKWLPATK